MKKTIKYLREAIEGEHQAVEKYQKFATVAYEEGFPKVALLFKALVNAEKVHIKNHQNAVKANSAPLDSHSDSDLSSIQKHRAKQENATNHELSIEAPHSTDSTKLNLENAVESEMYEYRTMYPNLLKAVKKEKKTMKWTREVELTHAKALKLALKQIEKGSDLQVESIWVCRVCGNLILSNTKDPPKELCPICRHDPHFFKQISESPPKIT
ncbi:MAG: hypothetical protein DRO88_03405 [Promethearchaeia archaeon]|nr:MAG: hypothetical protein DRO88_03405 [Candidatus Lokiarchaeia archaeon]